MSQSNASDTTKSASSSAEVVPALPVAEDIPDDSNVDLLLEKHRDAIAELRSLCPEVQQQEKYPFFDEIFFLRYVLSFKQPRKAAEAVKKCMAWRAQNQELINATLAGQFNLFETPSSEATEKGPFGHIIREVVKYQVAGPWDTRSLADAGFLVLIRGALGKPKLLFSNLTREENVQMQMAYRIGAYHHCDQVTRNSRRLSKQTLIFDVANMGFNDLVDPKQQKVYGEVSKASTYLFPQLIRKMCMVNAPKWMSIVMKIASAFLPKSTMEKIGTFRSWEKLLRSDFGKEYLKADYLPSFCGGKVPDDQLPPTLTGALISQNPEEEFTRIKVHARDTAHTKVSLPAPQSTIEIITRLDDYGINFEVALEHGEFDEAEAAKSAHSEDNDLSRLFRLSGRRTVLAEQVKLKAADGPRRTILHSVGPGVVTIRFDNTHSMIRSKSVHYAVRVDVGTNASKLQSKQGKSTDNSKVEGGSK